MKHILYFLFLFSFVFSDNLAKKKLFYQLSTEDNGAPSIDKINFEIIGYKVLQDNKFVLVITANHINGWHSYWKNPGTSGYPIQFFFEKSTLKEVPKKNEIFVEKILYPTPIKFLTDSTVSYGYKEHVPFFLEIKSLNQKKVNIKKLKKDKLVADFLLCKEICIPFKESFFLNTINPITDKDWNYWIRYLPQEIPNDMFKSYKCVVKDEQLIIKLKIKSNQKIIKSSFWEVFPSDNKYINTQSKVSASGTISDNLFFLSIPLKTQAALSIPSDYEMLIKMTSKEKTNGFKIGGVKTRKSNLSDSDIEENKRDFVFILFYAFLGGIILNIMPCVFPILSLKALTLINNNQSRKKLIKHTHFYMIGVVFSFVLMACVIALLKSTGQYLGWGFHLQNPVFLFFIILLLMFVALNLLGFFEFQVGLQAIKNKDAKWEAIFNGVIATVVATPCIGPFMGIAIGWALTQNILYIITTFAMMGLGMSFPFLLVSYIPYLAKKLPKPGQWMENFKKLMAFPIFATLIWLISIYQTLTGNFQILGYFLICFSLMLWLYGRFQLKKINFIPLIFIMISVFIFSIYLAIQLFYNERYKMMNEQEKEKSTDIYLDQYNLEWKKWSKNLVGDLVKSNRRIYIDFTADWCLSCQVNKRLTFNSKEVRQLIEDKNILLLRADWTRGNLAITKELESYNRYGVPFNIYIDRYGKEHLFPEIITAKTFIDIVSMK